MKTTTAEKTPSPRTPQEKLEEIVKCADDPKYFITNYLFIQHPTKGRLPFSLYPFQEECVDAFNQYRYNIVLKSRQLGLSTTTSAYCLWLALFRRDANILIMATKLEVGKFMIQKIRMAFKMLPEWMTEMLDISEPEANSVKNIVLSNGSRITAIPTSEDAGRGEAISLLIVDECVSGNTYVTLRNKKTGEIRNEKIEDLFVAAKNNNNQTTAAAAV